MDMSSTNEKLGISSPDVGQPKLQKGTYPALDLGDLPAEIINRTLGTELEPGPVHMSGLAHRHAAEKHPDDYPICRQHIAEVIRDPTFIGQAPNHRENIELLRRLREPPGSAVLVAVSLELDESGRYRVRSCYLVTEDEIGRKRQKGHIHLAQK